MGGLYAEIIPFQQT